MPPSQNRKCLGRQALHMDQETCHGFERGNYLWEFSHGEHLMSYLEHEETEVSNLRTHLDFWVNSSRDLGSQPTEITSMSYIMVRTGCRALRRREGRKNRCWLWLWTERGWVSTGSSGNTPGRVRAASAPHHALGSWIQ